MAELSPEARPWWRLLNKYHWYVFTLAALGWLFDTMDGQIFVMSRANAMADLLPTSTPAERIRYGTYVTSLFILGWATGGLIFGTIGDKWGRAKTMALTIFIYALFTGLSGLSRNWVEFGIFRFLTGMGVGGEFAAGAALVAEVMPEKARARALGFLQALSAVGNALGIVLYGYIEPRWGWQTLYFVGAFPALMAVVVRLGLKEPDRWVAAKKAATQAAASGSKVAFGKMSELFTNPALRKNTLVGLALGLSGVVGVWSVGYYSPELMPDSFPVMTPEVRANIQRAIELETPEAQLQALGAFSEAEARTYTDLVALRLKREDKIAAPQALLTPLTPEQRSQVNDLLGRSLTAPEMTALKTRAALMQQVGAFMGMFFFAVVAVRFGRRPAFLLAFLLAWGSVILTFTTFHHPSQIWYLFPLLGLGTLAPFGGYALYFPELFPTRLRTTGTGFCYNVGRYLAAGAPLVMGNFTALFAGRYEVSGFRIAILIVSSTYLIGMIALIWAPETRDRPLMDDERVIAH